MMWIFLQPSSHQRGLNPGHFACMHASALTISATETWSTESLNQRHLLIAKSLRATSNRWLRMPLVCNSILPVFHLANGRTKIVLLFVMFIVELSPDGTLIWKMKRATQDVCHRPHSDKGVIPSL